MIRPTGYALPARARVLPVTAIEQMRKVLAASVGHVQIPAPMSRVLIALLLVVASASSPASLPAQSDESGGLIGLVLPLGARTVGQGRAVAAERGELQALPYNPAAIVGLERGALTYSRFQGADLEDELDGFNGNYLAGAYVGRWGTLAGHFIYQDLGEVLLTDTSPDPIGSIDLSEWVVGLTYANEVRRKLAYGVTAKWYRSDLGVTEASGPAFDAGVSYRPRERVPIALAASLRNVGPDLDFEDTEDALPGTSGGGEESLPSRVRVGIAVTPERFPGLPEEYGVRLLFDIESDLRELSASSQHFGGVFTVHHAVEIRAGVLFADNPFLDDGDGDRLVGGAFGIGLRLEGFEAGIAREVSVSDLGDETHFGVGWRF
ncbi:MAG TPA: PorV/PorQ family protein [Gemmatimonadota bacterium]|nr:PorV/PorQ family protein [Gemmatimonadota bacterium]